MVNKIVRYIVRFIPLLISLAMGFVSLFPAGLERLELDKAEQIERIAALEEAYKAGEIAPVDEASFFDGDLEAELENGLKFNELRFLGTHNSYQPAPVEEFTKLYAQLSELTFGLVKAEKGTFNSQTLTQQLNCGIRSLEMDIETFDRGGEISFTCMHSPYIDMSTTCYDFELALKEIRMWSDNNPNHLPITIIIEPKAAFLPLEDMKYFNLDYALELDKTLRAGLGDKLFTPADMLRDYESFGAMRAADDWCKAEETLGKVLVLLHENSATTEDYIALDKSIKTQAMFPMLREKDIERDCTSFILINKPHELIEIKEDVIFDKKIMVRTRADKFTDISEEQLKNAMDSGAQIVSTDYPPRDDSTPDSYIVSFGSKTTVSAN